MITEVVTNLVLCLVISTKETPMYGLPCSNLYERYVELKSTNTDKPLPDGRMPNESSCGFGFERKYIQAFYDTMCCYGGKDESRWPDAIPIRYADHHPEAKGTMGEWSVSEKPLGYLHKEEFLKACDHFGIRRVARWPKGRITKEMFDAITPAEWEMVRREMMR